MERDIERSAALATTGNAIRTQARPEIRGAVDIFRYFGGLGGELKGSATAWPENALSYTRPEPIGSVGVIIAGNASMRTKS